MLKKIRNLWRFDGDEEPVTVSRRGFLYMGGIVAAGLALPELVASEPFLRISVTAEALRSAPWDGPFFVSYIPMFAREGVAVAGRGQTHQFQDYDSAYKFAVGLGRHYSQVGISYAIPGRPSWTVGEAR